MMNSGVAARAPCGDTRATTPVVTFIPIMFDREIQIRRGSYLPHWTKEGAIYHVRLRLADSLPQEKLKEWKEERMEIVRNAEKQKRSLAKSEQERLDFLHSEKVEQWLDAGYGACWLKRDKIASIVADTVRFFNEDRYKLLAWCIMPNHVHVVLQPLAYDLSEILNSWKWFTARKANNILKRHGTFWQREYFDHLLRNQESIERAIEYVWQNPEAAGFPNWQWRWRNDR